MGLLVVREVVHLTPRMRRVTFTAPEDLEHWPDQQLKLYFPRDGRRVPVLPPSDGDDMRWYQAFLAVPEQERPWMRSFTVRAHDPARDELDVDFVLHGATRSRRALGGGGRAGPGTRPLRPDRRLSDFAAGVLRLPAGR